MASEITNYQCPSCTGPLHFGSESGVLECDYCGSRYSVEDIEHMFAEKNAHAEDATREAEEKEAQEQLEEAQWDMESAGADWGEEEESLNAYNCPSCGAELICEETTAATSCPYCGNPSILPGKLSGSKKPDLIIPFQVDKAAAVAALKNHYRGKPLLPKVFKAENHIQEIKGVYVPFWLYDAQVSGDFTYRTTRVHTHTTPKEYITETDHFLVHRAGSLDFQNVPVDGSSQMPDGHMDAIEPYRFEDLKPFSLGYLPGFLADQYDVSKEECSQRANRRCAASMEDAMRNTVVGYASCVTIQKNVTVRPGKVRYALLPVWMLSTKWNGKNFLFAMNGQTGKLIGDLPIDKAKLALYCGGAFVAAAALSLLFLL
ncbi:MAG: hypothetical protein SOX71_06710 [Candidatus Faecousia sp.]|nr:hypothetical protein [Candidatus Faecousia sp.]